MRSLCYSVAMSLDGFIAGPKGEYDWIIDDPTLDMGALFSRFDTLLMGRRTFDLARSQGSLLESMRMRVVVVSSTLDAAARACDAVTRMFETADPHPEVFRLLANELGLLDSDPAQARPGNGLAFRLKLLLAAGIVPQLAACAMCGETEHLSGFSGAAGGVVCNACEAGAFSLSEDAYGFLVGALGSPLAGAPDGSALTLRQVERAIGDTAEHHAHVRLRPLLAA